jgi:hypothetical protein
MRIEWWYDEASYQYSDRSKVYLARLTVQDVGTARILTAGESLEFGNEEAAAIWLSDEEYSPLEFLQEDHPTDQRLQPPTANTDAELMKRLEIVLDPPHTPDRADSLQERV